jgi:hypothetical protein
MHPGKILGAGANYYGDAAERLRLARPQGPGRLLPAATGHHARLECLSPGDMLGFDRDDPETLRQALLAPRRLPVGSTEEVPHGLVEVSDGLLLDGHTALRQPRVIRPRGRQLTAAHRESRHSAASGTPPGLLLAAEVPHVPGIRAMPQQDCFLRGSWFKPVPGHARSLSPESDNQLRIPPRPEGRGFLRRYR